MIKLIYRFCLSVIIILLIFSFYSVVLAEPMSLKISPLTYKFEINKGGSESSTISIINPNQNNITVIAETENFIQGDEDGSPQFIGPDNNSQTLAGWIKIDKNEISLKANEKKDIPFEVLIPSYAESGGHYAAIFFKSKTTEGDGNQLGVAGRVGALVLVNVNGYTNKSGEIIEFKMPGFSEKGPIKFLARFKDTGNTHYQLGGKINIKNIFGKEVASLNIPEHIVLPGNARIFEIEWDAKEAFGRYMAELKMTDGDGNMKVKSQTFYIIPWKIILMVVISIIILIVVIFMVRRSIKRKNKFKGSIRG